MFKGDAKFLHGMYFPVVIEDSELTSPSRAGKELVLNSRRVYELNIGLEEHPTYGKLGLWWANGAWYLGPTASRGQPTGLLKLDTEDPLPLGRGWKAFFTSSKQWKQTDVSSKEFIERTATAKEEAERVEAEGGAAAEEEERISRWCEQLGEVRELLGAHALVPAPLSLSL